MSGFALAGLSRLSSGAASNTPSGLTLYQELFEITRSLCQAFPSLDPFRVRRTPTREVFLLIRRINTHPKTVNGEKVDKQGRIRRPAGDNWF